MTPPDPQQVAAIAGRLSKAQREAVFRHCPNQPYGSESEGWAGSAREETSFQNAGRALMDMKLIRWADDRSSATLLTPLGLAVRNFIQGNHHD